MTHPAAVFIRQWWPALMLVGAIFIATIEARYQINQLMKDKTINESQWVSIRANGANITSLATKTIEYDRVITPEAQQQWGQVKADVKRHEQDIKDLQQAQ